MNAAVLPDDTTPVVHLHPGQVVISREPMVVSTILGSCVAVCLWDPVARVAGINHFLLPSIPVAGSTDARYGNAAMKRLIHEFEERGASLLRVMAKVFGGATVLAGFAKPNSIGDQNVALAHQLLAQHGIDIVAEQTGGRRGRKLRFDTSNGSVWIKEL
jgi:chemotaxis protein CheD